MRLDEFLKAEYENFRNQVIGDPTSGSGSGGGSGTGSGSGSGTGAAYDPCAPGNSDATGVCKVLGKAEGGKGSYTERNDDTGASGRYQFKNDTWNEEAVKAGLANNASEAQALWDECSISDSARCMEVQDKMCEQYVKTISNFLQRNGLPTTLTRDMYIAWNQGPTGAKLILEADKNNTNVTSHTVIKGMLDQGFNKTHTTNGREFMTQLDGYLRGQGLDPTAPV